jgi:transcriptional regulator with XRE-family HTH domain
MYFETLQTRLINAVNLRVRNGELTERRLARMIGISQPHMHNLLKGARILSPQMGDRILKKLRMSVLDLCEPDESACAKPPSPECYLCRHNGRSGAALKP